MAVGGLTRKTLAHEGDHSPIADPWTAEDVVAHTFTGSPEIQRPYGVVFLPSFFLDEMDERWLEWIRRNRESCASVNLAFFSRRLRDADAVPGHCVWLDSPTVYRKGAENVVEFIQLFQFNETVKIWGGFDAWYYNESIRQSIHTLSNGEKLPAWCVDDRMQLNEQGRRLVAGQYTSCAAVNILSYVLGWFCTIFVVGNMGQGDYCELCLKMTERYQEARRILRKRRYSADNHQWWWLRKQAREQSMVEIVHVGNSPTETVPRMSEAEALRILEG